MNITIKEWIIVAIILLAGIAYIAMAEKSTPSAGQQKDSFVYNGT